MERFSIDVPKGESIVSFDIIDYAHDDDNRCKFEVFKDNRLVASFEPDSRGFLHVCKNPGDINEEILEYIAEKIESYNF